jgi:hypothetical protein
MMWRMKQMIGQGKIETLGDVGKSWKEFDVRLAGGHIEEAHIESGVVNEL